jgi:hypothetical protein
MHSKALLSKSAAKKFLTFFSLVINDKNPAAKPDIKALIF